MPTYASEYSDEAVDYALTASYPLIGHEPVGMSPAYGSQSPTRGWNTTSSQPLRDSTDSMYFHSATTPSYHGLPYQGPNYSLRHSVSTDSSNFSLQNMASSLPTPTTLATSTDRVLPMPSSNRSNSISNSGLINLATSADGLPYSVPSIKNGNLALPSPSTPMSYMPLSTSPDSAPSYGSNYIPTQSQEIYAGANGNDDWTSKSHQAEEPALRSQDSSSELYYMATSDNGRKSSQSGQVGISGTLSNGQVYHVPYPQEHIITRKQSLDTAHVATHRHSNASLRAA